MGPFWELDRPIPSLSRVHVLHLRMLYGWFKSEYSVILLVEGAEKRLECAFLERMFQHCFLALDLFIN